jgi:hypothetical protein
MVRAIVARRAAALNSRRAALLDQARDRAAALGRAVPAEDLVQALIVPQIEELDRGGHYVGFLARLSAEGHRVPWVADLDDSSTPASAKSPQVGRWDILLGQRGVPPYVARRRFARRLPVASRRQRQGDVTPCHF